MLGLQNGPAGQPREGRRYPCVACAATFPALATLLAHQAAHTEGGAVGGAPGLPAASPSSCICSCGQAFPGFEAMLRHTCLRRGSATPDCLGLSSPAGPADSSPAVAPPPPPPPLPLLTLPQGGSPPGPLAPASEEPPGSAPERAAPDTPTPAPGGADEKTGASSRPPAEPLGSPAPPSVTPPPPEAPEAPPVLLGPRAGGLRLVPFTVGPCAKPWPLPGPPEPPPATPPPCGERRGPVRPAPGLRAVISQLRPLLPRPGRREGGAPAARSPLAPPRLLLQASGSTVSLNRRFLPLVRLAAEGPFPGGQRHRCGRCQRAFPTLRALAEHRDAHHLRESVFGCRRCGRLLVSRDPVGRHACPPGPPPPGPPSFSRGTVLPAPRRAAAGPAWHRRGEGVPASGQRSPGKQHRCPVCRRSYARRFGLKTHRCPGAPSPGKPSPDQDWIRPATFIHPQSSGSCSVGTATEPLWIKTEPEPEPAGPGASARDPPPRSELRPFHLTPPCRSSAPAPSFLLLPQSPQGRPLFQAALAPLPPEPGGGRRDSSVAAPRNPLLEPVFWADRETPGSLKPFSPESASDLAPESGAPGWSQIPAAGCWDSLCHFPAARRLMDKAAGRSAGTGPGPPTDGPPTAQVEQVKVKLEEEEEEEEEEEGGKRPGKPEPEENGVGPPPRPKPHARKRYACACCGNRYTRRSSLLVHRRKCRRREGEQQAAPAPGQSAQKRFACGLCGNSYTRRYNLQVHQLRCPLAGAVKKEEEEEVQSGSGEGGTGGRSAGGSAPKPDGVGEKRFFCAHCGAGYTRLYNMRMHQQHCAARPPPAGEPAPGPRQPAEKKFVCELCGRGYTRRYRLRAHQERCGPGGGGAGSPVPRPGPPAEKRFVCERCGNGYTRHYTLIRHQRKCPAAGGGARDGPGDLGGGGAAEGASLGLPNGLGWEGAAKGFRWDAQGSRLLSAKSARAQLAAAAKPFICGHCGAGYNRRYRLRAHHRKCHAPEDAPSPAAEARGPGGGGGRPFVCRGCGGSFTRRYGLRRHQGTCAAFLRQQQADGTGGGEPGAQAGAAAPAQGGELGAELLLRRLQTQAGKIGKETRGPPRGHAQVQQCRACGRHFLHRRSLLRHRRRGTCVSGQAAPPRCPRCRAQLSSLAELCRHLRGGSCRASGSAYPAQDPAGREGEP
ncbi:zinc finger protein 316-like [Lepisosteus oculatus]|uniref:zinc finger protein 316-like n=1 Tax=Lepisosteus oculatus TaxID=7918 RepID=UPI00371E0C10